MRDNPRPYLSLLSIYWTFLTFNISDARSSLIVYHPKTSSFFPSSYPDDVHPKKPNTSSIHTPVSGSVATLATTIRGGSTSSIGSNENNDVPPDLKWRMQQQQLLQLRSTFLSEALAARGVPLTTMLEVSTLDIDKPPEEVDWDCVMSTEKDPKSCLYSFDAQPNTKVLAPHSTTQYISLIALNRLRRTDPTKVEPMWHSQYSILKSWFGDESPFSLMQHIGIKGFFVSNVLLDWGNGMVLRGMVLGALWLVWSSILFPVVEYLSKRLLVSGFFWSFYGHWSKIAHAAFPLKLLMAQMGWKMVVGKLEALTNWIRNYVVEWECQILEESIPITIGDDDDDDEILNDDDNDEMLDDDNEEMSDDDDDEFEDDTNE